MVQYAMDPVRFLLSRLHDHGGLFTLNLAANRIVILGAFFSIFFSPLPSYR